MKLFRSERMERTAEQTWTQTSVPTIYKKSGTSDANRSTGFTFLEILAVLTLAALLMGLAVPQFFAFFTKPHQAEFQHLSRVLKLLRNDAVLKSNSYCLIFDLKAQQVGVTEVKKNSGKCSGELLQEPKALKPHDFPEDLILRQAQFAGNASTAFDSSLVADVPADLLEVRIDRSGFVTPFLLTFTLPDASRSWEIESKGIMGKPELREQ